MRARAEHGQRVTSASSIEDRPPSACTRPMVMWKLVLLPAPLGPSRPTTSPRLHLEADAVDDRALAVDLHQPLAPPAVAGRTGRPGPAAVRARRSWLASRRDVAAELRRRETRGRARAARGGASTTTCPSCRAGSGRREGEQVAGVVALAVARLGATRHGDDASDVVEDCIIAGASRSPCSTITSPWQ